MASAHARSSVRAARVWLKYATPLAVLSRRPWNAETWGDQARGVVCRTRSAADRSIFSSGL
eukprot:scaffold30733_cov129-Isochrysis_galbana.AAC.3